MWSSKMAARWRGKDGLLNGNNRDFVTSHDQHEMIVSRGDVADLERSAQTCVDHSILAIFEDSSLAPENKMRVDEENEKLLSALTEMLDSVGDDGDTLSPFDTLPESQLLVRPVCRDGSVMEPLTERLRPRPKSSLVSVESDGEEQNIRSQRFKQESPADNKMVENEVEVFTSASLVNLVKLMHPYCLKLHVDEGDKPKTTSSLFSGEEVWRYEKPTEENDEEINVVSDDEAPQNKTEEDEHGQGNRSNGQFLKSVLVKRNSPRAPSSKEKKRVSFGSVQVASFDESPQRGSNGENLTSGSSIETVSCPSNGSKALKVPLGSALEPQTPPSETNSDKAAVVTGKGETKAKALSLQQYRQLRQKRQPLVEKQGNYTTKWPLVSEPPKELLPFPCLQEQRQNSSKPKTVLHHPQSTSIPTDSPHKPGSKTTPPPKPSQAKPSGRVHRIGLKRPRTQSSIISPVSPLPNITDDTNVGVLQSKRKATLASSDPPNPVLLPLAVCQQPTAAPIDHSSPEPKLDPDSNLESTRHLQQDQTESSYACPERQASSSQPKPQVLLLIQDSTALLQEIKAKISEMPSDVPSTSSALCSSVIQMDSAAQCGKLQPQICSLKPRHETKDTPDAATQIKCHSLLSAQTSCPEDAQIAVRETPEVLPGVSPQKTTAESGIEAPDVTSLLEQFEETQGTSETLRKLPQLQISEHVPEALSTEIILSTEKDQPARRKKAIQIIDPRPLPPKRIHPGPSESPAKYSSSHLQLSVSSDHDYCGPVDRSLTSATQRSRAKPSSLKDIHVPGWDSSAAAQWETQTSSGEVRPLSAQPRARAEDRALLILDCATGDGAAADPHHTCCASCALPTPPPSPLSRGREQRRNRRSPQSDSSCSSTSSSSSSGSRSPKRQKRRHKRSESSSRSSSCSRSVSRTPPRRNRLPYSRSRPGRSRSRSWSRSRSRSPSPRIRHRRWRDVYSSRDSRRLRREQEIRIQKLKAIDERRVVYVGRIRRSMTHNELRDRFSQFGEVECVSLHFRDRGDHYAFVTFYNMEDAFAAIDNGGKLRQPDELPFDICFGGRRQFCNSNYSDLDADRDTDLSPATSRLEDLDFDSLLKQAQRGVER